MCLYECIVASFYFIVGSPVADVQFVVKAIGVSFEEKFGCDSKLFCHAS